MLQQGPIEDAVSLEDVRNTFITRADQLAELEAAIAAATRTAVDTETYKGELPVESWVESSMWAVLRVISVATRDTSGEVTSYVIDVRDIPRDRVASTMALIPCAEAWNANFDDRILFLNGAPIGQWRDAMLTDAVLHAGVQGFGWYHGLAWASKRYLGLDLSGKGTTQTSFDGTSNLTDAQVAYAAQDAVVTLWVSEELDRLAGEAGLTAAVDLEHRARPFIAAMTNNGFPFRVDGWRAYLATHETAMEEAMATMAELTGGDELTLFGATGRPTWNPDSDVDLKKALNAHIPELVRAATGGALLDRTHSVDKAMLGHMAQIPGLLKASGADPGKIATLQKQTELPKAVLEYRKHSKTLSTYGDKLLEFVARDGRIHPRYIQALTATGRLRSDRPNAQNLAPAMKSYIIPTQKDGRVRVIVHADLSQAEQRVLAFLTQEEGLIQALSTGGDIHADTAARMFHVDMASLATSDPAAYAMHRKKAKGVSFGIPYGLRAGSLSTRLTLDTGTEVTFRDAQELLDAYAKANPKVDAWLSARDDYVSGVGHQQSEVDWEASFRLHDLWVTADPIRSQLRRKLGHAPTNEEVADAIESQSACEDRLRRQLGRDPTAEELDAERAKLTADLDWTFSYSAPVVLMHDGEPFAFESRTETGRRRLFTVPMDSDPTDKFAGVITSAALTIATTDKPVPARIRDAFAAEHELNLPRGTDRYPKLDNETPQKYRARLRQSRTSERSAVVKAFEGKNKPLKAELVRRAMSEMGPEAATWLLRESLNDQVRSLANAYRNAPIQGLVADIVLEAFGEMWSRLGSFEDALPIQSVHDSVAIECFLDEAPEVALMVKSALEDAMTKWCPGVRAIADADIRLSMKDADVVATVSNEGTVEWKVDRDSVDPEAAAASLAA